jgi:hypothetical protein
MTCKKSIWAFAPLLVAGACGGITGSDDAGADATSDHLANPDGVVSDDAGDASSDASKDVVDTADDALDDVTHLHNTCSTPSQCDGGDAGGAVCCSTLTFKTNNNMCLLDSLTSSCASAESCPTSFQPFCSGNELLRQCDYNADCTEQSYPVCCTFYFDTTFTSYKTGLRLCTNQNTANAADASCGP